MGIFNSQIVTLQQLKNECMLPRVWSSPDHGAGPELKITVFDLTESWADIDFFTCIGTNPRHHRHIRFWVQVNPEADLDAIADELPYAAMAERGILVETDPAGQWVRAQTQSPPWGWPEKLDLFDLYKWARTQGVHLALPASILFPSLRSSTVVDEPGFWNIFQFHKQGRQFQYRTASQLEQRRDCGDEVE